MVNEKEIEAKFKPRARLLVQLGDQLIKNESIALVELVKNAYDADANVVNIYMENPDDLEEGIIIIEDDGFGMTTDIVENVWLEPGSDFKSKMIKNNVYSPKYNRLPIGEKGIGRFGVHKLGNIIEMTTRSKNNKEVYVRIDWSNFENYKYLEEVPIKIIERESPLLFKDNKTGTNIIIRKLRKKWDRTTVREVKRAITSLASPFQSSESFVPSFEVMDKPGWFDGLLSWENVKDFTLFKFYIEIKGDEIVDFKYQFTPWSTMTKIHSRVVELENELVSTYKKIYSIGDDKRKINNNLSLHRIGNVKFEGYLFDLDSFILKLGVSDKKGFKDYMRVNGGVKVFRDGLRIYDYGEPENDWLGLDYRRFQQPTKAISNNLILGAVYLDRALSSDLEEKTNREGFVDNDAYQCFKNAILHCIDLVEILRLSDKKKIREFYGPTSKSEPVMQVLAEAKSFVESKVNEQSVRRQIIKYLDKIEFDYQRVTNNLLKAAGAGLSMSVVVHEVEKVIFEVEKVLKAENGSGRVLELVKHLSSLIDGYSEIIRRSPSSSSDIVEVIDQALFNTEYRLNAHKITVLKKYKQFHGSKKVKIPKNLIIGCLMNVIDNSIFWLDKKQSLHANSGSLFDKKIYIDLIEDKEFIKLVFADNGTGFLIPTEDIVEPFVSAKPGGMGLGLHITSEILESQGGSLLFPDSGDFDLIPSEYSEGAIIVFVIKK